ncbi:IS110 family transposase [Burkholderia multivorans]|uniref:IS110 family transposase n=1 Tax=Burkholderia multivorans TaxID=87883 RepID=UPI00158B48D5|nr:IS110 family transposase [Burkholderia multivorans]
MTNVGIDVAKEVHWVCAVDTNGVLLLNHKLLNTPADLQALVAELRRLPTPIRVGIDILGGIASLIQAVILEAGFELLHIPGVAVNRAREGTAGGEAKSDPRDARVIADLIRTRRDLRKVTADSEIDIELRLLVSRRRDLTEEQTRRLARMHDLLASIFPELEHCLDLRRKTDLCLLRSWVTPEEFRAVTDDQILAQLESGKVQAFARKLMAQVRVCAEKQTIALPGERLTASLIRELADEALRNRQREVELDRDIAARLTAHPDAALIRSLPGMGALLTAEFIAVAGPTVRFRSPDALASAAGLAPVLKQSGKSSWLKRPQKGDKRLKRIFYQSAFASIRCPESAAFYARKRKEGKRHHQIIIALARRRVNVLWAILHNRTPYVPKPLLLS